MSKLWAKIKENILFIETLILLAFIPLYPKLPLINVRNTWVYIRAEDFLIVVVLLTWFILLFKKKVSLKTPLTIPIFIFWLVGAIATFNGILFIFPSLANVFPNVAFLTLLRHIEYLSLFFVAFAAMKNRSFLRYVSITLILTLIGVIIYGAGQKYLGFPAFLTSNEEFAKGIPIQLSQLSRVPSTFAGQYDLAAYLVIIIPILVSLIFGLKNWLVRIFLTIVTIASFVLLFWTVSRVSFFAVLAALFIVLLFQKRKLAIASALVILVGAAVLLTIKPALLDRFKSTVSQTDVLVDAQTGDAVGNVRFVPNTFFKDKLVLQRRVSNESELVNQLAGQAGAPSASLSAVLPFELIPPQAPLVEAANLSTGENLPQGTGYINLTLSPVVERVDNFFYEFPPNVKASMSAQFIILHGNFIIKRAAAYDLSFTTRFQGEWPVALGAFTRNIPTGSGYGSVTLAVDNNYLRILGETGLLGFLAFLILFISYGIYLKRSWKELLPGLEKSFIVGFSAGIAGLAINASLIDVYESSKIAYLLWMLMGISFGIFVLSLKQKLDLFSEIKKVATSTWAVIVYIFALTGVLYYQIINNFFIGDDFTWLRWAAQPPVNLLSYFINSQGFFYRPGTKLYFYLMYHFFWLNPLAYHLVSVGLHFLVAVLFYLLAAKIFKNKLLSFLSAFLFLVMSGYTEMVFWIAATGHLISIVLGLLGLLLFLKWEEKRHVFYYLGAFVSFALTLLFYELGMVLPLLILVFKAKDGLKDALNTLRSKHFLAFYLPVALYLVIRFFSNSQWFSGDYSYNLLKLPFNVVGNILGYLALIIIGPNALGIYEKLRSVGRDNLILSALVTVVALVLLYYAFKFLRKFFDKDEKKIMLFGFLFFVVALLPFLGLGDITPRYSYLATLGIIPILVMLIHKVYRYLLVNGREIAVMSMTIVIMIYSLFQIISVEQTAADWAGASVMVNNFLVSFDSQYSNYWQSEPVSFHFVDVPIKYGQSWVFPVGLPDAVWFAVKNDNAKIYIDPNLTQALEEVGNSSSDRIFVFQSDGSLKAVGTRLLSNK